MSDPDQPLFPLPNVPPAGRPAPDIPPPSPPIGGGKGSGNRIKKSHIFGPVVGLAAVSLIWFWFTTKGKHQPAEPTIPNSTEQTVTQTIAESGSASLQSDGDLSLWVPMSRPRCDGLGIVVLASLVTPGRYTEDVRRALSQYPGSSYLRTDQSCPSLRQATEQGNPIYAVYRTAGYRLNEVCTAVREAGGTAYGKWLDTTTPPSYIIPC